MQLGQHQLSFLLFLALLSHFFVARCQEEGSITKKARFAKASSMYLQTGPGIAFGSSTGDYRGGIHFELGFLRRINRILSIGPALSYQRFGYKTEYSNSFSGKHPKGNNIFFEEGGYQVQIISPSGGNVQLMSLGARFTAFIVAPKDENSTTFFIVACPKITSTSRSAITANSETWYVDTIPPGEASQWSFSEKVYLNSESAGRSGWAKESAIAAGLEVGIGTQVAMGQGFKLLFSGTVNAGFGIPHINTKAFRPILASYNDPQFPFSTKTFTTFNLTAGISYTF